MGIQATSPPTSPLHRMSPLLKRKHETGCLDFVDINDITEPKKICIEFVCSTTTTTTTTTEVVQNGHKEENKENEQSLKETSTASTAINKVTATTATPPTTTATTESSQNGHKENDSSLKETSTTTTITLPSVTTAATTTTTTMTIDTMLTSKEERKPSEPEKSDCEGVVDNPKVIVEHQPLPSIYDLRQMTCDESYDDSGMSDDESSEEESSECDDDEEEEDVRPSPIFEPVLRGTSNAKPVVTPSPPNPKGLYNNDRFWSGNAFSMNNQNQPGSPLPPSATPVAMNGNTTFHFLENNNQRIECAENGKSYLQLGTMSHHGHHHHHHHHHLPVTPVIQPKPNMVYRRPIPPFRNPMLPVQPARPVCDHSNCLMRKSSLCYKSLRSRMLNLSLHKLHMARQNHEGSLRRSVLICNMLRYIEDETEKEAVQETQHFVAAAPPQPPPPQPINHMDTDQYWPPAVSSNVGMSMSNNMSGSEEDVQQQHYGVSGSQNGMVAPYGVVGSCGGTNCGGNGTHCGLMNGQGVNNGQGLTDTYETTLKDFNSAFRSTPYSSPAHPGMDVDSGLGSGDEDRGINWGSVLSLSSQSELDPLNNNSFSTETWQSSQSVGNGGGGSVGDTLDISSHNGFDDIGWKLSAEDVLKAFPSDDGLFSVVGSGPA